jgi:hypothetical protein
MALRFRYKTKEEVPNELSKLYTEREALNSRLSTIQIDQGVVAAATKRGLRPTAIRVIHVIRG